jgi:hypothetical protein
MTDDSDNYLWQKRYDVLYRAQLSVLYHRRRERFFAFWDRTVTAVAIAGGSAAFAGLGGPDYVKGAAALVALTSTVGLVFGLAERARRHSELARQFLGLEASILRVGERDFTEVQVAQWTAESREIEAAELPTLGLLVLDCQNTLAQARGELSAIHSLTGWQRLTMHFSDHRTAGAYHT